MTRRKLIGAGLGSAAGVAGLAAAAKIAERYGLIPPDHGGLYGPGETLTYAAQRLLARQSMAREFPRSAISTAPFANSQAPPEEQFKRLQAGSFGEWRLTVDGLVARPASFSLAELRSFPVRSQLTHLACEEGWSFIAEWTGVPLAHVLGVVGIAPQAKYVIYSSIQSDWWDSVDLDEALHPQTLVTYGLNGGDLPVPHGGPLRLRVPRQLGYKSVKFINRLTVTGRPRGLGSAAPGAGYAWYAGI